MQIWVEAEGEKEVERLDDDFIKLGERMEERDRLMVERDECSPLPSLPSDDKFITLGQRMEEIERRMIQRDESMGRRMEEYKRQMDNNHKTVEIKLEELSGQIANLSKIFTEYLQSSILPLTASLSHLFLRSLSPVYLPSVITSSSSAPIFFWLLLLITNRDQSMTCRTILLACLRTSIPFIYSHHPPPPFFLLSPLLQFIFYFDR